MVQGRFVCFAAQVETHYLCCPLGFITLDAVGDGFQGVKTPKGGPSYGEEEQDDFGFEGEGKGGDQIGMNAFAGSRGPDQQGQDGQPVNTEPLPVLVFSKQEPLGCAHDRQDRPKQAGLKFLGRAAQAAVYCGEKGQCACQQVGGERNLGIEKAQEITLPV